MSEFAKWKLIPELTELICYKCSNCGFVARADEVKNYFSTFCPDCESIMDLIDDEED